MIFDEVLDSYKHCEKLMHEAFVTNMETRADVAAADTDFCQCYTSTEVC